MLPARGGAAPELHVVDRAAPSGIPEAERAVTAADYAEARCVTRKRANAMAIPGWTGGQTMLVYIDRRGTGGDRAFRLDLLAHTEHTADGFDG